MARKGEIMPGTLFNFKKRSSERNRRSEEARAYQEVESKQRWKKDAGDKIISMVIDSSMRDLGKKLLEHVLPMLSPVEKEFVSRKYPPALQKERDALDMLSYGGSREGRDALDEARTALKTADYSLLAESVPREQITFLKFLVKTSTLPEYRSRSVSEGVDVARFYEFFTRDKLHLKIADALDSAGHLPSLSKVLRNLSIII